MAKPSDYFLSDEENAAIFERLIRPAEFGDTSCGGQSAIKTAPQPVCIILAGQTGAGKSHAAPILAAALQEAASWAWPPVCHLVADSHKPYHPAYASLVAMTQAGQKPPCSPSLAAGPDARRWLARACAVAAEQHRDTLVESASRFPEDVARMGRVFRRAGFRVCLVLVAAHPVQSRLGLVARYLDTIDGAVAKPEKTEKTEKTENPENPQKTNGRTKPPLGPRLTPRKIHDETYDGLSQVADWIDRGRVDSPDGPDEVDVDADMPLADAVLILRRSNLVAYANYHTATAGRSSPGVRQALEFERMRRDVTAETAMFTADVARLSARHPERKEELEALVAEYQSAQVIPETIETREAEGRIALQPLDAAALVARLRNSEDDGSGRDI